MFLAQYRFSEVVGGFFEFPTDNARRLLPPHLEPVELHHGTSIFSMSVFDIAESPVGPHRSVAMSVLVVPLLKDGADRMPNMAFCPFLFGSTSAAARELAMSHLHIPHWMEDVQIDIERKGKVVETRVRAGESPIADLEISEYSWEPVSHVYQCFVKDATGAFMTSIHTEGRLSEHEEESGKITLYDHPFNTGLSIADVYDTPLRQTIMRDGVQSFEPLIQLQPV